jgi:FKBP-type peptidyl-prolyl cis-trans isomerase FkpA
MKQITFLLLGFFILFLGCKPRSKKQEGGIEYTIISGGGNGATLGDGNFFLFHVEQVYDNGKKDSLMNDTRKSEPVIDQLINKNMSPKYFKIFSQLKVGDSLVMRELIDSIFANREDYIPPFFKKGNYFVTKIKILNIFKTQAEVSAFIDGKNKERMAIDDKILQDYFGKNKITATKAPKGTYVEILQNGSGNLIDTNVVVKVNYTGKTMEGVIFDSNTDPSKGHVEPFNVNMTSDWALGTPVIAGWLDGLQLLSKGAKAKFYIPSPMAYGGKQMRRDIKPNSILIFDIEVLDVMDRERAIAEANEKMKMRLKKTEMLQKKDSAKTRP